MNRNELLTYLYELQYHYDCHVDLPKDGSIRLRMDMTNFIIALFLIRDNRLVLTIEDITFSELNAAKEILNLLLRFLKFPETADTYLEIHPTVYLDTGGLVDVTQTVSSQD